MCVYKITHICHHYCIPAGVVFPAFLLKLITLFFVIYGRWSV